MSDQAIAPVSEGASAPDLNARDLSALFTQAREEPQEQEQAAESADDATAAPKLADEANADPATDPGETKEAEAAEPPIERPKSWSKDEDAEWQSLPRAMQQKIVARELERDKGTLRSQQEAAETRKAAQAQAEAAEKARQEYEAKLPALMQALHETSPFADIQNMADVEKLQAEDPFRFQQFQVYQWKMQGVQAELQQAEQRKATETQTKWAQSVQEENAKAAEFIPELADKEKGPALVKRVAEELLPELGFKSDELADLAAGKSKLSIYDHRIQRLLADGLKLRDIQKAKIAVVAKPAPPVLRPGAAKPPGSAQSETIQNLSAKLERSGSPKDLGALIGAMRRA
ncbi:hypothetical protein [Bradyrhizobium sp. LVM 105]|uniref:hypothetical protein n=1 Tax=Bradyrhizobium sp. LVM 105 TaxID=2341115 RepID=UPI000F7FFC0B|nr:hypothetical protein [Bradyrhizobium sp. LVM 105]RTE91902.1 hypothetical protein D6B98_15925 [Bradyrhizobium sp. LVM 105]